MSAEYGDFLAQKSIVHTPTGISEPSGIHANLFPHQDAIVRWALRRGRACIFAGTGLGKTAMQCEFARHVADYAEGPVLILAPLAVSTQTIEEARKIIGTKVVPAHGDEEVADRGIYITNYQKLHRFTPSRFAGVVLDESSIIKHEEGKFRKMLMDAFRDTPFKLACTATPAPNDFMEIGNHSEFVGSMSMSEMLATFFVHDGGETQKWRLKKHAEADFWRWMASWAVCIQKPSDLGFADDGYNLPPLRTHEHIVESTTRKDGEIFATLASTLQERRSARRESLGGRVARAAELIAGRGGQWGVWCNLNDESAALTEMIPGAIEVKGGDSDEHKEEAMRDFAAGRIQTLVSKPSICGFGMNWQNCHQTVFVGLSDSFEQLYQAIRRYWRFGQKNPVDVHIIISEAEGAVLANIKRKEAAAAKMYAALVSHMAELTKREMAAGAISKLTYSPSVPMSVPRWLVENVENEPSR